jgi:hypothetical protein
VRPGGTAHRVTDPHHSGTHIPAEQWFLYLTHATQFLSVQQAATQAATPMDRTSQTQTTPNKSALIIRTTGRPQTVSILTAPVS